MLEYTGLLNAAAESELKLCLENWWKLLNNMLMTQVDSGS